MLYTKDRFAGGDAGGGGPLSPQTSRNSTGHSRFVEGSMNDRISAAPPPSFMGPEELLAYEKQFYLQPRGNHHLDANTIKRGNGAAHAGHGYQSSSHHRRPGSSTGQSFMNGKKASSAGSKFFAPLWDGVREKLHLTRSKSSGEIAAGNKKEQQEKEQKRIRMMPAPAPAPMSLQPSPVVETGVPPQNLYPSREEVLENYKSLMASGFFSSHATQGTRHPLPPQPRRSISAHAVVVPPPPLSRPLPIPARSFAQHMASREQPPVRRFSSSSRTSQTNVLAFSSIPYTSTRPPTAAEAPSTVPPPPRDNIMPSFAPLGNQAMEELEHAGHDQRGTKRGPPGDGENQARKLVKKLRKSASRISTDLSLTSNKDTSKPRPSTTSAVSVPGSASTGYFPLPSIRQ